jgi:hypothetical protein
MLSILVKNAYLFTSFFAATWALPPCRRLGGMGGSALFSALYFYYFFAYTDSFAL